MKNFIKQLFCTHIYKQIGEEVFLRKERDNGNDYKYYAIYRECVKCKKLHVKEI